MILNTGVRYIKWCTLCDIIEGKSEVALRLKVILLCLIDVEGFFVLYEVLPALSFANSYNSTSGFILLLMHVGSD